MADPADLIPAFEETNRPYWEGLKDRRLRMVRCDSCTTYRRQAVRYCPACGGTDYEWRDLSGRGWLWGRCVFHQVYFEAFRTRVPYGVVVVELAEGPRVYANLSGDVDTMQVPIGSELQAVFEDVSDTAALLKFAPV